MATDYCVKNTALDALKEGFRVKALEDAMRAVEVKPGDGERAIEDMRAAGASIVNTEPTEEPLPNVDRTLMRKVATEPN